MLVTRFAPSPTGYLHIGGARTALFAWLWARHHAGRFILRIEDTDRERSTPEAIEAIFEGMRWLGLEWDEGPYFQTQRMDRYREVIDQLLAQGHAYHCTCTKEELDQMRKEQQQRKEKPRYDGRCRYRTEPRPGINPVVRFRTPDEGEISFNDLIKGRITWRNTELDDLIIARSDGSPTYNLTVVVDDIDMGMTCIIRGDDHVNNTPRQLHIFHALGATIPDYAHVPMICGEDGRPLSKRHGAVSVTQFREDGFLPEALLNYLVRLSWSHGDQELFSVDEMIQQFDLGKVQKSPAIFNIKKLIWLNHQHLQQARPEKIAELLRHHLDRRGVDSSQGPDLTEVVKAQVERCKTLEEMADKSVFFYHQPETTDSKAQIKFLNLKTLLILQELMLRFEKLSPWDPRSIHATFDQLTQELDLNLGQLAQPLRVAVSGGTISPPIDVTLALLGQKVTLKRLYQAIEQIHQEYPDAPDRMSQPKISIIHGDITQAKTDAIVNAANQSLLGGGGVDGAIHTAAGPLMLEECRDLGACPVGEARITSGYQLATRLVIHAVGPAWNNGRCGEAQMLRFCYRHAYQLGHEYKIQSIALPAISCGAHGYPPEEASAIALDEALRALKTYPELKSIHFYCYDHAMLEIYMGQAESQGIRYHRLTCPRPKGPLIKS